MNLLDTAKLSHEVNRAICQCFGDDSQPPWDQAPSWQQGSAIAGVKFHHANPDAGPAASHNEWMRVKREDGWVYGFKKDPERKTHPCMVEYDLLPASQRVKDYAFRVIAHQWDGQL